MMEGGAVAVAVAVAGLKGEATLVGSGAEEVRGEGDAVVVGPVQTAVLTAGGGMGLGVAAVVATVGVSAAAGTKGFASMLRPDPTTVEGKGVSCLAVKGEGLVEAGVN